MKKLIIEITMLLAEILLGWAFSMSPNDDNKGLKIKKAIMQYFET